MFINDIWSCGVTTKTKKIVAEAQKDGYLLNFLQLELEEGGLPNWKTINSFCELVATSTQNNPPDEAMQSPQEKFDRLMNAIFLKKTLFLPAKSSYLQNWNPLIAGTGLRQQLFT